MTAPVAHRPYIAFYPFALLTAWVAAWLCNLALRADVGWGSSADTIYWILLKLAVWVAPALVLIRTVERAPLVDFLEFRRVAAGVRWGLGIGGAIALVNFAAKTLPSGSGLRLPQFDLIFLNAVVVSPLVKRWRSRSRVSSETAGARCHRFWIANLLTTVVFVAMHLPGWYFQGHTATLDNRAADATGSPQPDLSAGPSIGPDRSTARSAHAINNLDSLL